MNRFPSPAHAPRVLVAGGGVAALEAVLALREHAAQRVAIELLAPTDELVYRPLSVLDPFGAGGVRRYPLAEMAADLGAGLRQDGLAAVRPEQHAVRTDAGEQLRYDVLVVATGAERHPAFDRVLTFSDEGDVEAAHGLIQDIEQGYTKRVGFVVPEGVSWTLPLYELALMTATRAREMFVDDLALTLVTPEVAPLALFGPEVSAGVYGLLEGAGIAVETSSAARVEAGHSIVIEARGEPLVCDRVIALPHLRGRPVAGLPADSLGFLPVDEHGRVHGVEDVFAAGDGTAYAVKQGGLAAQQADAVSAEIARRIGLPVTPRPFEPVLRALLLTGSRPRYLRRSLSENGPGEISEQPLWWPPTKIAGARLAPYLDARDAAGGDESVERSLAAHPSPGVRRRAVLAPRGEGEQRRVLLPVEQEDA